MRGNTNYGNALPAEWRLQVYGINSDNYRVLTLPDKVLLVANNYTNTTNIKLYLIKDSEVIAHKIIQHQCDIIGPDFLMQGETAQYTIPPYNPIVNWTLNNTIKFVITDEENTNSAHVYARGTFPGQTTLTASNPTNNSIISSKVIAYIETQQVALSIARNANGWDTIKLFSAPNQICLPIHRDSILKNIANYNAQHYWYANRRDITTGLDAVNNVFNYRIQKDDNHIALNLRYGSIGSAKVFIKINLSANDMTYNITESFCYIYYTSDENKNQFISLLNQYAACQCRLNIQSSDIISAAIHSASKQGIITNERDAGIFCMRRRYVDFLREDNEIYLSLSRIAGYTTKFQVVNIHHSKIPEQTCRILNRYITK
jgi:hypothetical protein